MQLQINLDKATGIMQNFVNVKIERIEKQIKYLEDHSRLARSRMASFGGLLAERKQDIFRLESRMDKIERSFAGIESMYRQVCNMHDAMQRSLSVTPHQFQLAVELAEKQSAYTPVGSPTYSPPPVSPQYSVE